MELKVRDGKEDARVPVGAILNSSPKILLEPHTYITSTGGKQIRTHLMDAFNQWLSIIPAPRVEVIARIVSMLVYCKPNPISHFHRLIITLFVMGCRVDDIEDQP